MIARLHHQLVYQWQLFLIALGFFTRIPVPPSPLYEQGGLQQASRYYGLVGLLVGGVSAAVYWLASWLWPESVAILLAMATGMLITGGFHEDGLADSWDGFGGGWSPEQKMAIMKDSRLGTYGALALVMALLLKYQLLVSLAAITPSLMVVSLLVAHCLSRVVSVSLIFDQPYVRDTDSSKVKPMTREQSLTELVILLMSTLLCLWLLPLFLCGVLVLTLLCLRWGLVLWFKQQLGGYTGDTLGAVQQIAELGCYLVLLAWFLPELSGVAGG